MKKLFIKSMLCVFAFCFVAVMAINPLNSLAAGEQHNLIPESDEWTVEKVNGNDIEFSWDDNGALLMKGQDNWPSLNFTYPDGIGIDTKKDAYLHVKFTMKSGSCAILLQTGLTSVENVPIHHLLDGAEFDPNSGDMTKTGTYELIINILDLKLNDATKENNYLGTKPLDAAIDSDGMMVFDAIKIYCTGYGDIVFNKFEIVTEAKAEDVSIEPSVSSEEPSSSIASNSSEETTADTSSDAKSEASSLPDSSSLNPDASSQNQSDVPSDDNEDEGMNTWIWIGIGGSIIIIGGVLFFVLSKKK